MTRQSSETSLAATNEALEILCAKHLHQCFWIPANDQLGHGRLRVTYSTTSNFEDETLPVVLFFHPMFGGRYSVAAFDHLAKEKGVRVVAPDRPGMGGSSQVPLAIRMQTWLEIVPALLKHLGIEHVHLMSHSAGTMYLMNTLYARREALLDGKGTYVGIIAPWVHNDYSGVNMWNIVSKLPNGMLDSWNGIVKFINGKVAPSLAWSGGAISSVAGMFQSGAGEGNTSADSLVKLYGTNKEVANEIQRLQSKFYFAEDTTAGNEDARLCLKMGGTDLWGRCEDYSEFVRSLVNDEKKRKDANSNAPGLKVRVFYAESDAMIGKGGQAYFEECWSQDGVPGPIDYEGKELPGTDHDSAAADAEKSALPQIFEDIAAMSRSKSSATQPPSEAQDATA